MADKKFCPDWINCRNREKIRSAATQDGAYSFQKLYFRQQLFCNNQSLYHPYALRIALRKTCVHIPASSQCMGRWGIAM
ncbi:MAG: hypothetical protein LBQ75_07920 [Zoogloeaceae bacterium]|jgi:hypothetical protein|nr:hypothetical protein [Zoogloeaceae bacterium]